MDKKDIVFEETFFDDNVYQDTRRAFEKMAADLPQVLWALQAENIPTDLKFLKKITEAEDSFSDWVSERKAERLGNQWLPTSEKDRVTRIYDELLRDLSAPVSRLRHYLSNGLPIIEDGDKIKVDDSELDKLCREKATKKVDTKRLTEVYARVKKIDEDVKELSTYLTTNGLPDITRSFSAVVGWTPSGGGQVIEVDMLRDVLKDFSKEHFFDTMKTYFIAKE